MAVIDSAELLLQAKNYSGSGAWQDESGNGHHAQLGSTSGADTNDPTFDVDHFDLTTDDYFEIADHADLDFADGEDFTLLAVAAYNGSGAMTLVGKGNIDANPAYQIYSTTGSNILGRIRDAGAASSNGGGPSNMPGAGVKFVAGMVRDDTAPTLEWFLDGTGSGAPDTTDIGDLSNAHPLTIGSSQGGSYWAGAIYAVALWRSALSDADVATATQELTGADQDMTPGLAQQLIVAFDPTVTSTIDMTPALVQQLIVAFGPTLTYTADMTPAVVQQLVVAFDPTVTTGAVAMTPGLAQQLIVAFDPTVTSTIDMTPGLVQQLVVAFDPTVAPGAVDMTPALAQQLVVAFDPVVALTSVLDMTPALAQQLVVAFAPTIYPGRLPGAYDAAVFYRNGATSFIIAVGLARSVGVGYRKSESWYPASGRFALPMGPGEEAACMAVAAAAWAVDKTSSNAVLYARVNTALSTAGYRRANGAPIT